MEILFLYLSLLLIVIILLFILKRHIEKIINFLDIKINELIYIFTSTIYKNKIEIEKSQDEALYLLFSNKNKYLHSLTMYNVYLFYNFFNSLKEDINYISSFFQEEILSNQEFIKVDKYFNFIFKLCKYYIFFYIIFLIFTLWLGKFLIKKDLCKKFDNK